MTQTKLLFCAAILICSSSFAQDVDMVVHFPKGSAEIEPQSLLDLQHWALGHYHLHQKQILLRGHTDKDADAHYNQKLSTQRNEAVKSVLTENGYSTVEYESYGEDWPICLSEGEDCMHSNRRVEVLLMDEVYEVLMYDTQKVVPEVSFVRVEKDAEIKTDEGTLVKIPSNCFLHADGSAVTGEVRFEVKEFYNFKDCIQKKLCTTSDGKLLESGGMLYLSAAQGTEQLQIAAGKNLDLTFASQREKPEDGMQIFTGEIKDGNLNWTNPQSGRVITPEPYLYEIDSVKNDVPTKGKKKFTFMDHSIEAIYEPDQPTQYYLWTVQEGKAVYEEGLSAYDKSRLLALLKKWDGKYTYSYKKVPNPAARASLVFPAKNLGRINCDRFISQPAVNLSVSYIGDCPAINLLIIDDLNSLLFCYTKIDEQQIVARNMPIGQKCHLFSYSKIKDKIYYSFVEIEIGSTNMPVVKLEETTQENLDALLAQYDRPI
jgi:OmpA family